MCSWLDIRGLELADYWLELADHWLELAERCHVAKSRRRTIRVVPRFDTVISKALADAGFGNRSQPIGEAEQELTYHRDST